MRVDDRLLERWRAAPDPERPIELTAPCLRFSVKAAVQQKTVAPCYSPPAIAVCCRGSLGNHYRRSLQLFFKLRDNVVCNVLEDGFPGPDRIATTSVDAALDVDGSDPAIFGVVDRSPDDQNR